MMDARVARYYREFRSLGESAFRSLDMARTEARAEDFEDVRVRWEYDEFPDVSWLDARQLKEMDEGRAFMLLGLAEVRCGECGDWRSVDCVGGVHVGPRGSDDPYCRILGAELLHAALAYQHPTES